MPKQTEDQIHTITPDCLDEPVNYYRVASAKQYAYWGVIFTNFSLFLSQVTSPH